MKTASIKQNIANMVIYRARKMFYNTPVIRWKLTGYIYNRVFSVGMPDLTKPVAFRNITMYVDPSDRSYVPTVVAGYYEKLELDIFDQLCDLSPIFLDVGANVGMFSLIAAKNSPSIRCYAFEPVSENQELLQKNIKLNKVASRVKLVKRAVSNQSGTATIHLSKSMSGTHSLSVDHGGESRDIKTITVDDFCKQNDVIPSVIKIDVEGHEVNVLDGMKKTLRQKPTIFMEYIPQIHSKMDELVAQLAEKYQMLYVVDELSESIKSVTFADLSKDRMSNIILVNNKSHIKAIESYLENA